MGELGDEVENPRRNVPLTIAVGLSIVAIIYMGVGWLVSGTLSVGELKDSRAALLHSAERRLPWPWVSHYLNISALFAGIMAVNAAFLAVPRELAALAEEGILPKKVMKFNEARQTFPVGIAIVAMAGCLLVTSNLNPDDYGLLCVGGLMMANVLLSVAALRLYRMFPEKMATSPLRIPKGWLYPCCVLSTFLSLGFSVMAAVYRWPVAVAIAACVVSIVIVSRLTLDRSGSVK
jgi:APA family basic amino acid/polyamine antiporter